MKFRLLLFFNSILLLNSIHCEEATREGRVLNRRTSDYEPSIEQQTIQEYSQNVTVSDASFNDVIDEIIDSSHQGRSIDGLDEVYQDPTVKQALLSGDDTQARNLIRDKLCDLGLMECEKRAPTRYIYTQPPGSLPNYNRGPPPQSPVYNQRPVQRPPPQTAGIYGQPRPVPLPGHPQVPQGPPRKVGYAPNNNLNNFYGSKPIADKYNTDFYEVEQAGSAIKFGYTEKPTIIVNQGNTGKRDVGVPVSQNHHVHHHYVHVDGAAAVDGSKIVVNTPISEYSAVNSLSGTYQTSGFSANNGNSGGFSSGGYSPSSTDFEYKGVNSGQSPGVYGESSNVKPVFESNQYAAGSNYNQQTSLNPNLGPAVFTDGSNGIYNVGSSYHAGAPDFYKKELNLNGNRGNYLGQNQQNSQKYNKYNQGEQYQGFEASRQDHYDCQCVPVEQCPAHDIVGRRDDLILPLDPRNLPTDIEADGDNSTSTRVVKEIGTQNSTEVHKVSKRDTEKVDGEGSLPAQAPGSAEGSDNVSFPSSRRRRDTDQVVPASLEKKEDLSSVDSGETDSEGRALAGKRQAFYQQKQCGPRAVCCRRPLRTPQQLGNQQFGAQQFGSQNQVASQGQFGAQQSQFGQQGQQGQFGSQQGQFGSQQGQFGSQQNLQAKYSRCGTRNSQGINGRIKNPAYVDGDSEFGEYPWQAAILKKDPKESVYVCGGTLIDESHIVTAAHCVKTYSGFDLRVRLGEWDVNHDVEFYPYVERDVISVHVHPEYYAGTLDNDLAILKLSQPVDFSGTPHISPACLPDKFTDFTRQRCWTTGWGKDNWDFGKYQNILKEVDVPIIDQNTCQNQLRQTRLGYNYKLNPGFICAGGEEGKDACKGDGGGPLVCERNGVWQVAGIVSWGIGCGKVNVPGVYVRVSHYLDWIAQITQRY